MTDSTNSRRPAHLARFAPDVAARIVELVDQAPPLSADQRDRIALLFRPVVAGPADERVT